ncbi:unnamed protein product, partial [Mesorhabditis spiculigera]
MEEPVDFQSLLMGLAGEPQEQKPLLPSTPGTVSDFTLFDSPSLPASEARSQRGGQLYYDELGYEYRSYRVDSTGKANFRCCARRCTGKAYWQGDGLPVTRKSNHNHPPPTFAKEVRHINESTKIWPHGPQSATEAVAEQLKTVPPYIKPLIKEASLKRKAMRLKKARKNQNTLNSAPSAVQSDVLANLLNQNTTALQTCEDCGSQEPDEKMFQCLECAKNLCSYCGLSMHKSHIEKVEPLGPRQVKALTENAKQLADKAMSFYSEFIPNEHADVQKKIQLSLQLLARKADEVEKCTRISDAEFQSNYVRGFLELFSGYTDEYLPSLKKFSNQLEAMITQLAGENSQ